MLYHNTAKLFSDIYLEDSYLLTEILAHPCSDAFIIEKLETA